MRLRISIQRHSLPPTNILWNVPETSSPLAYTIARLLEDVNHIVPLEAEHWGLEDYVVEVQGFECLHFSPVSQALKEDDLVSIRPLLTAEVRARTLTGRVQINDGGQHLIDGIPFGRPYLRKPYRPAVRIPPRKRQRLNEDTEAGVDEVDAIGLITANGEDSHDSSVLSKGVTSPAEHVTRRHSNSRTVQFKKPIVEQNDDSSDSEADEDFAPGVESSDSMAEDSDDSDSDSSESSDSDASSSDSDSDSSSCSNSSSDSSSGPEVHKILHPKPTANGVPGKGSKVTRSRNHRRRDGVQLKKLKALGVLHQDASLEDMRSWNSEDATAREQRIAYAKEHAVIEGLDVSGPPRKRKRGAVEATQETQTSDNLTELERRKQELMTQMGEDDAPLSAPISTEPTPAPTTTEYAYAPVESTPATIETIPTLAPAEPTRKRLRPDTSAISRILARQTQPLAKKSARIKAAEPAPEPEAYNPDLWKSKINLSAFECWEEDFELSAPPFPFKQHWDEASNLIRQKVNEQKKKKKRKTSPRESHVVEELEETVVLDYGDAPDTDMKEVDEDIEAIESQLRQDVEVAAQSDLPPVPEDLDSLPIFTRDEVKVGAIIVFKVFEMRRGAPEINVKTAVVETEGDSGNGAGIIGVRLAERDREKTEHKYDKHGERIYEKADNFRLHNGEDEDEDDGWRDFDFNELMDAKLLQAAVKTA